jgi:hypothetical protein
MKVLALLVLLCSSAYGQQLANSPASGCVVSFAVATQDTLKNMKWGLSAKDVEWANKLLKKYPGVCYTNSTSQAHAVLFITVTPDTYHGTRTVTETSTTTSASDSTKDSTTTSSHEVPYSVDYGIFTLLVERVQPDGNLKTPQTFQQRGLYNEIYGIPLGGRGHHPAHAVIEDAVKWLSAGGLTDPDQSSNLISRPAGTLPLKRAA